MNFSWRAGGRGGGVEEEMGVLKFFEGVGGGS